MEEDTVLEEARQVSTELERRRLRKVEEDRLAVRNISETYYECLLCYTLLVWSKIGHVTQRTGETH